MINRLLAFDDALKEAYHYYQGLILAVAHCSKAQFNHLLAIKWAHPPQHLQKFQRTLRTHKQ